LLAIGATTSIYKTYQLASFVALYARRSSLPRYLSQSPPSWALVTGASDGIGAGFAQELLASGFNVILHGRNPSKLSDLKSRLQTEYPDRSIDIVVADATDVLTSVSTITDLVKEKGYLLTVLVNNIGGVVGLGGPGFTTIDTISATHMDALIDLNARFMLHLTRSLLPLLGQHKHKTPRTSDIDAHSTSSPETPRPPHPALIMTISSAASPAALPFLTLYASLKSLASTFSVALGHELALLGRPVESIGILVANVSSAMNKSPTSLFTPSSRAMARAALGKVGCGRREVWGYWAHGVQAAVVFGVLGRRVREGMLGPVQLESWRNERREMAEASKED